MSERRVALYFVGMFTLSMGLQIGLAVTNRGFVGDQMIFLSWMNDLHAVGLSGIYQHADVNYPPMYLILLRGYVSLALWLHLTITPGSGLAKLPGLVLGACSMISVYWASRGVATRRRLWILALFCFNPAILYDTAVWGQVDILDDTLALLAVMYVRTHRLAAGILFALALLSKFQAIVVCPVLGVYILHEMWRAKSWRPGLAFSLGFSIPSIIIGGYFLAVGSLGTMIEQAYIVTTGEYPFLNMNAMNIWYNLFPVSPGTLDTSPLVFGIDGKWIGLGFLTLATLYVVLYLVYAVTDVQEKLLKAATLGSFSFYLFPTEIHERYIVMAVIFAIGVCLYDPRWTLLAIGLTLTAYGNLVAVVTHNINPTADEWMVYLNLVLYTAMIVLTRKRWWIRAQRERHSHLAGG